MKQYAELVCINPKCGKIYPIKSTTIHCDKCQFLLDVSYKETPPTKLKEIFYQRRNPQGSIYNESGVWRFRELLNFCEIETDELDQCSEHLVSLDGAEGRQSKPYHMSKVSILLEFLMIILCYNQKVTILVAPLKIMVWRQLSHMLK